MPVRAGSLSFSFVRDLCRNWLTNNIRIVYTSQLVYQSRGPRVVYADRDHVLHLVIYYKHYKVMRRLFKPLWPFAKKIGHPCLGVYFILLPLIRESNRVAFKYEAGMIIIQYIFWIISSLAANVWEGKFPICVVAVRRRCIFA
jgi:hypothetical protein